MRARPVDADGHEVKYRGSAAHDVQRDPHVTQSVSKLPLGVVHLNHTHTHTHTHTHARTHGSRDSQTDGFRYCKFGDSAGVLTSADRVGLG